MNDDTASAASRDNLQVNRYGWKDIGRRFRPLLAPYRWRIALAMTLVALVGVAVAVMPLFPKYVIDNAIPQKSIRLALAAAGIFIAIQFSRMVFWYLAMKIVYRVQQSVVFQLRARSFNHLQRLCLSFHSRFPSGFLYERVFGTSINALGTFMQTFMQNFSTHLTGLFFSMFICFYFSWSLTLIIIAGAVAYVTAARLLAPRIYRRSEAAAQAQMRVTEIIMDRLHGHKTIQAFSMEERVQRQFEDQVWQAQERWISGVMETMKFSFVNEGISYWLTAFVVVGGAWQLIYHDNLEIGVLVAFIGYQGTLIGIIQTLTNVYSQFTTTRVAFDQLFTILDTHTDVPEKPGAAMPEEIEGRLTVENVSFGYTRKMVLDEVSFTMNPGETVALVGRSGCGKTTITNLLMRFYDPAGGAIRLDGVDIRELPLNQYRSLFGVVLQDPYLFDTTIRDNLALARPDASEEEMIAALTNAKAWEFVEELDGRLDFRVGEGGSRLSGGQRQRLAIARCMLLKSRFVLLDEATSALDPESEAFIQESFAALSRGRTVLVIAHRLNTLRNADRIVVMDQGRVVESGSYAELLECRGLFHRLHSIATAGSEHERRLAAAGFA